MSITAISTKGQIVIPKSIRDSLDLKPGTRLMVKVLDGKIILEPIKMQDPAERLRGKFKGEDLLKALEEEHHKEISLEYGEGKGKSNS